MSRNYEQIKARYSKQISQHYTWSFNQVHDVSSLSILRRSKGTCLDLGSGSGEQSLSLLDMGWNVVAIDSSAQLLDELKNDYVIQDRKSQLETYEGDLLLFPALVGEQRRFEAAICIGDTITDLASLEELKLLFNRVFESLLPGGTFILDFRDLSNELLDNDRFIPIKSDERTIFSCFLEFQETTVKVHDLIHVKKGVGAWELLTSSYHKLRVSGDQCREMLQSAGFSNLQTLDKAMVQITCSKGL